MDDFDTLPAHVTVSVFTKQMLGVSREWYYKHKDDPDIPKRIYIKGKPMLVTAEAIDYIKSMHLDRELTGRLPPKTKNPPRRVGRPRKVRAGA